MSVIAAYLSLPEDLSLYTPYRAMGSVTGASASALQTIASITGKGYLLDAIVSVGNGQVNNGPVVEFKLTIDGAVYYWASYTLSGFNPSIGLIDLDALTGTYRRQVAFGGNGATASGFSTVAGIGGNSSVGVNTRPSATKTTGAMVIRQPIPFNSSVLLEASIGSIGYPIIYEVHATYK